MRTRNDRRTRGTRSDRSRRGCAAVAALLAVALLTGPAFAGPPPPPPPAGHNSPPPPASWVPEPVYVPVPGAAPVPAGPPPLPVAMRVIYAPFYAAGLIIRYGFYYVLVAPFEVLFRTIDYGASGGVDPNPTPTQGP
jgi:hypothetical protein